MYVSMIAFFLVLVSKGQAEIGIIVLLIPMLDRIQRVVGRTVELVTVIIEANAYLNVLDPMLEEKHDAQKTARPSASWAHIGVRDLRFDYTSGQDQFQLRVDEMQFSRGQRIGIIGRSGHGKSTFLDLLAGHHEPQWGTVSIDGSPYATIEQNFFRDTFSFIAQDADLFNMTLRENILLGVDVRQDRLHEILKGSHLLPLVKQLKDGLDTMVGERGIRLSMGERQRVNIARGIVLNREVYLFDEVTSNVDKQTERRIFDYLFETLRGKTVFIVSHRVENLQRMDRILIFEDGKIAGDGTYAELERTNAIFRNLLAHPDKPTAAPKE